MKSSLPMQTRIIEHIYADIQKRDVLFLPLRLFIGLGWLRAGVEKGINPQWHSSAGLQAFFTERIADGDVVFPFYLALMEGPFTQFGDILSSIIVVGEFFVGLALIFGFFTRPALIAGLFMNLNFVLAGSVNPSAFYIIIQLALLQSNVGRVLGIDGILASWGIYRPFREQNAAFYRRCQMACAAGAITTTLLALVSIPFIQTFDPAESIDDGAMFLLILFGLTTIQLLIAGFRFHHKVSQVEEGAINKRHENLSESKQFLGVYSQS